MSNAFWFGFWVGLSAGWVATALFKQQSTSPSLETYLLRSETAGHQQPAGTIRTSLADRLTPSTTHTTTTPSQT